MTSLQQEHDIGAGHMCSDEKRDCMLCSKQVYHPSRKLHISCCEQSFLERRWLEVASPELRILMQHIFSAAVDSWLEPWIISACCRYSGVKKAAGGLVVCGLVRWSKEMAQKMAQNGWLPRVAIYLAGRCDVWLSRQRGNIGNIMYGSRTSRGNIVGGKY